MALFIHGRCTKWYGWQLAERHLIYVFAPRSTASDIHAPSYRDRIHKRADTYNTTVECVVHVHAPTLRTCEGVVIRANIRTYIYIHGADTYARAVGAAAYCWWMRGTRAHWATKGMRALCVYRSQTTAGMEGVETDRYTLPKWNGPANSASETVMRTRGDTTYMHQLCALILISWSDHTRKIAIYRWNNTSIINIH